MDLLKTLDQNTLNDSRFLLLYIDDDEIPEIYITGPKGAAPSYTMLTYCNGKVTGEDTSPNFANYNSIYYIKKGGQFYTAGGRQGFMEERIFSLNQGKFALEHEISYSNSKTQGEIKDCIYDGQPVNTAQHDSNLNKDFDFNNAILPAESKIDSKHGEIVEVEKEYTYSELVEILSN